MAMSPALRKKLIAAIGSGAVAIAAVLLPPLEDTVYAPYRDGGGVWTVCTGHTGPDVIPSHHYTPAQCDAFLKSDIRIADNSVNRLVKVPMTATQEAALTSFVFNVGSGNFARSSVLRYINAGHYTAACESLKKWVYIGKDKSPGLMNRRAIESELCMWGDND